MDTKAQYQTPKIPVRAYRTLPNSGLAEVKVTPEKLATDLKDLILSNFDELYNRIGSYCDFAIDDKKDAFKITLNWTSKKDLAEWKREVIQLISTYFGFKSYHATTRGYTTWNVHFSDGNWNCYGTGIILRKSEIEAQIRVREEMQAEAEQAMNYV